MSVLSFIQEEKKKCLPRREGVDAASIYGAGGGVRRRARAVAVVGGGPPRADKMAARVATARAHRHRALQNELADAHYHLSELTNENRLLRALQKKHEIALQRYENSSAEVPQLLRAHAEEMRVQRARQRTLKQQLAEVSQKLKERETELQALKDEHRHLQELAKDKQLGEREQLRSELEDARVDAARTADALAALQRRCALEERARKSRARASPAARVQPPPIDALLQHTDKIEQLFQLKDRSSETGLTRGSAKRGITAAASKSRLPSLSSANSKPSLVDESLPAADVDILTKLVESGSRSVSADSVISRISSDIQIASEARGTSDSRSSNGRSSNSDSRRREIDSRGSDSRASIESRSDGVQRSSSESRGARKKNPRQKLRKEERSIEDLATTVKAGMAELSLLEEEGTIQATPRDNSLDLNAMKLELMKKVKGEELKKVLSPESDERPWSSGKPKLNGILKKTSDSHSDDYTDESTSDAPSRSRYVSRRNSERSVEFLGCEGRTTRSPSPSAPPPRARLAASIQDDTYHKAKSDEVLEDYCHGIMKDIEHSSDVIERHARAFNSARAQGDQLMRQLEVLDQVNDFVNGKAGDINFSEDLVIEMNNNFRALSEASDGKSRLIPGQRAIQDRAYSPDEPRPASKTKNGRPRIKSSNSFGDSKLSNQDLLNDLLGNDRS